MQQPIAILSTKVLSAGSRAKAGQEGCLLENVPFIHIAYVKAPWTNGYGMKGVTAIFTSAHAVKAYAAAEGGYRPEIKAVFCIAGATEKAVQQVLPAAEIKASRPYAAELLAEIIALHCTAEHLVFFCGDQRMATIPEGLQQAGIAYEACVMYYTTASPQVISAVYDGVLFFSPSAVQSFFSCNVLPEQTLAFAIGHTTANALYHYTDKVHIAPRPDEEEMVSYAIAVCRQQKT